MHLRTFFCTICKLMGPVNVHIFTNDVHMCTLHGWCVYIHSDVHKCTMICAINMHICTFCAQGCAHMHNVVHMCAMVCSCTNFICVYAHKDVYMCSSDWHIRMCCAQGCEHVRNDEHKCTRGAHLHNIVHNWCVMHNWYVFVHFIITRAQWMCTCSQMMCIHVIICIYALLLMCTGTLSSLH